MNKKIRFSLLTLLVMLCGTVFAEDIKATLTGTNMVVSGVSSTSYSDYLENGLTDDKGNVYYGRWCHQKSGSAYLNMVQIKKTESSTATRINLPKYPGNLKKITLTVTNASSTSTTDGTGAKTRLAIINSTTYNTATATNAENQVLVAGSSSDTNTSYVFDFTTLDENYDGEGLYICSLDAAARIWSLEAEYASAAPAAGYTVDFNQNIIVPTSNTAAPVFQVSIGWTRIAPSAAGDGYGPYYMRYNYSADQGVDGSGALLANAQCAPQSTYDGAIEEVNDYIVTPKVSGTVTLQVKGSSSANSNYPSYVKFFAINDDATEVGDEIVPSFSADINNDDYVTASITLTEATRIAIRAQWVYMDNFTATAAEVPEVKSLTVASVMNMEGKEGTSGTTTYFEQQQDGSLSVPLKVLLSNTGNVDFVAGTTENYTLTLATASYASGAKTYYDEATVAVPVSLAAGESDTIEVTFNIPYSSGWKYYFVKENVSGTTSSSSRYAGVTAYEPKFVFRAAESTSTSSLSAAQTFGLISETTTKSFEIANTGTAPLIIKSITLPEGFTSANKPEITGEGLSIAKGAAQALDITLPADVQGAFAGTLTIVYLDKNAAEQTYTLAFSGNVLPAGTWSADFAGDGGIGYPAGSIAEGGINSDYQYSDGAYNYFIKGRTTSSYASENNKFITPKLHATAGQTMTFDVKGVYGSSYYAKVYVSTDRKTWGDPVAYFTYGETEGAVAIGSSDWVNKSITFEAEGDYYVAFSLYGEFKIDNIIGLTKVDVAHDLYIKSVNWPDASVKSGTSLSKPSLDVIPLTDEAADAYTVKYVCGETVLAEGTPVELTASANSSKTFSFSWTPVVESTTAYPATKVVFEFTDGTKIETDPFDLTVTNEPKFHFVSTLPSSKWYEPSDVSTPIAFGKTNEALVKTFYVYNWGSAPLTVTSVKAPDGFTATPAGEFIVPAFDENDLSVAAQAVQITFSAEEAGEYSGNLIVSYLNGAGEDQNFEIAISGTKLDPAKWYANFGTESNQWPAGSVYQSNVSTSNIGTYSAPDYAITSASTTNNIFVTPKLTAAAGDKLMFDAKLYSSYWNEGKVVVYVAATRNEVLNAEEGTTRTQLFAVSGTDETNPMTTDFQTFEVTVPEAGDYFFGFEISNRPYIDEIYGLAPAAVAHDWMIASSNIPAEAMQNVAAAATVNILNLGVADEAADSYTATLFINGEAAATAEAVALPMAHQLSAAGTQLSFNFRYPKAGTFPAYIEVKAGEYTVATDPVNVTFAEEIPLADAIAIGTKSGNGRDYGFVDWYNNDGSATRYTDIVYPAAKLTAAGMKAGDKILQIAFRATNSAKTFNAVVTSWVGMLTGDVTLGTPDKDAMTEVSVYNGSVEFPANFESVINIAANPIVWDGTSDIRVYTESVGQGSGNWISATYDYDSEISMSYNGTTKAAPLAYFTLAAEAAVFSGTVKNAEGEAIENATITLVSNDGDNVQYAGVTDAEGAFSINVIQASRTYDVTVVAGGDYENIVTTIAFNGESREKNFVVDVPLMAKYFVNTDLSSTEGWTAFISEVYKEIGNGKIGEYAVYNNIPATVDETHLATENAFGFECRWATNFSSYNQESKIELTAGSYTLTFDVENVNASTTSANYDNLFKVTVGDAVYPDESTEWMKGKSSWTTHSIHFTVDQAEKAIISFGYGTGSNNIGSANTPILYVSHLGLTYKSLLDGAIEALEAEIAKAEALKTEARTAGLDEFNAAITTAKGYLTSDDVPAINAAVEALKVAEEAFLVANLPVEADTYYVYNPLTQKFLSRGNAWGTSAVVDDYGVAVKVAVADLPNAAYTLTGFDINNTYGDDTWMYTDAGGDRSRTYTFAQVEGGYTMTNTNNSQLVYVYMKDDADKYRVAGNAIKDDNYTDDAQTVWQFITPAERDAMVAAREAAAKKAAFESAGVAEDAVLIEGDATEVSFTTGNAWTQTVVRTEKNQPATNENGTEMWQATGYYTQTIAELPSGLYKVSIQAFYRNGGADEDVARVATGYNTVLAYLEANGNKAQVKSWASDKGEGNDPNSMAQAKAKFDEGKYLSEFYTYVGEDGLLNLKVDNPAHIGNGWFIVGNVKYVKVNPEVIIYPEDGSTVAAPQFSVAAGTYYEAQTVELTAEEGAEIYYVLDDSQLSSKSTKYTEPIAVAEATTIRAFAVKDGKGSAEVQAAYVFGQTAADIAAFKALETGTIAQLTLTDAVVTVASAKNIFIEDATGGICIYDTSLDLKKGDKLNGTIIGKVAIFKNLPELTAVAGETSLDKVVITEDGEVTPAVVTIEEASTMTYAARMITIKSVEVTVDGKKTYVSDGVNSIQIYKQTGYGADFTMPEAGKKLQSITGLLIPFNDIFEICPLTQDDIVVDNPTGINSMMAEGQKTIYNMKGQKMEKTKKGLNIINGKKVVVK